MIGHIATHRLQKVADVVRLYAADAANQSLLERASQHPALPAGWRDSLPKFTAADGAMATRVSADTLSKAKNTTVNKVVQAGVAALAADDRSALRDAFEAVLAMVDVLGLSPWAHPWSGASSATGDRQTEVIDSLVRALLDQRAEARARQRQMQHQQHQVVV